MTVITIVDAALLEEVAKISVEGSTAKTISGDKSILKKILKAIAGKTFVEPIIIKGQRAYKGTGPKDTLLERLKAALRVPLSIEGDITVREG